MVSAALMGRERTMREDLRYTLLSFLIYLAWMIAEAVCASRGLISWSAVAVMYSYNMVGVLGFYALIRSGFSNRFADSSMVLIQVIYAVAALMIAYALVPETRAAALQTPCITVVFGMLTLRPRETVIACIWSIAMLLATVARMFWFEAPRLDVQQELINVSAACIVLPALTWITHHFALLRERLKSQREQIRSALARAETLATRDALTNLINRAQMMEILNQEITRSQRFGSAFSLALLDIDHFKSINDNHGHQTGDEVLVAFANLAEAGQRQTDVIARWGGEEFLILMPQTPLASAQTVIGRLREAMANASLSKTVAGLAVTTSAGIAQWRTGETLAQTIERADRALYVAKKGGRNRVELAQ
jgi:diguanylate cyclase (GGDEF)-like protein